MRLYDFLSIYLEIYDILAVVYPASLGVMDGLEQSFEVNSSKLDVIARWSKTLLRR